MKELKTAFFEGLKQVEEGLPPKIEINSDKEAVVYGCRGILEYSPERIRLITSKMTICFCGCDLVITSMDRAAVVVCGKIISIEFLC